MSVSTELPIAAHAGGQGRRTIAIERLAQALVLAVAYYALARLGLQLQFQQTQATPVWPPSGLAFAAVLLCGYRVSGGVFLGALFANVIDFYVKSGGGELIHPAGLIQHLRIHPEHLLMSAAIAAGNTLEAIAGCFLVRRFHPNTDSILAHVRGVLTLCVSAGIACTVSSTIGSLSLVYGTAASPTMFEPIWRTWWLGDATGILILSPFVIAVWPLRRQRVEFGKVLTAIAPLIVLFLFNQITFNGWWDSGLKRAIYLLFPILLLIAFRFGTIAATAGIIITCVSAVFATISGNGPFARADQTEALTLVQGFVSVVAVTALFLSAVIAERTQALIASVNALEQFKMLFDSAPNGAVVVDSGGRIVQVNPQMQDMFGYAREELVGQPIEMLVPDRLRREHVDFRRQFTRARQARAMGAGRELFGRRKDGNEFPVEIGLAPVSSSGGNLVLASVVNISERRQSEQQLSELLGALRTGKEQHRFALDAADAGSWNWDMVTGIRWWSDEFRRLLGMPPGSVPSLEAFRARVHPLDRHAVEDNLQRCLKGQGRYEVEFRVIETGDDPRWIVSKGRVDHDESGRPLRMVGILQDITARKRAEQERNHLRSRLMQAQEQERLRLAHELHDQTGQQLTAVMLQLKDLERLMTPDERARLQTVRKLLEDVSKTLHHVAWELRPASIDELGLAAALGEYVSGWSARSGIEAEFDCRDGNIDQLSDAIRTAIYRIVQESLNNVAKHAPESTLVSVLIIRPGPMLQLTIEDNGQGFDPTLQNGRQAKREGGLGLATMRERLRAIGGQLEIESSVDGGTTIFARIPLEQERLIA